MDVKLILGIIIIIGGWLISGAVAYTTVRMSIKRLMEETMKNAENIKTVEKKLFSQLFDEHSRPLYQSKIDCDKMNLERDARRDNAMRAMCNHIDEVKKVVKKIEKGQNEINITISNLLGKLEPYIVKRNEKP
uniref:Uncharacterized protein n=1 Tax=viral metagenome TaxID=1070528 RepID=A0A6M3JK69_9ZZZZ